MSSARGPRRPPRRYLVKGADGRELVCPSLGDLHTLYAQGFLTDDDLVRAEGARDWVPLGRFPALGGTRAQRHDGRRMWALLAAVAALSLGFWLLLRR